MSFTGSTNTGYFFSKKKKRVPHYPDVLRTGSMHFLKSLFLFVSLSSSHATIITNRL